MVLSRESIAECLLHPAPAHDASDLHMAAIAAGARVTQAAVMLPLVNRDVGIQVLLTQRTAHLNDHAGQISFPGGRVEASDATRAETALRETEEEIGLSRNHIAVLGTLAEYEIPSGFRITPVVGWIQPPFELELDAFEVAAAFEVPLLHFMDTARYQRRAYTFRGRHRHYLAIPFEGRYIWGATAAMLYSFARMLAAHAP